jgi:hypothetical protein
VNPLVTADTATEDEGAAADRECARALDRIGLPRNRWTLLTAVHEAAHVVVADTVDMATGEVRITRSTHVLGRGHATSATRHSGPYTLPQILAVRSAGFEGAWLWMLARGYPKTLDTQRPLTLAAGGDIRAVIADCRAAGRPDLVPPDDGRPPPDSVIGLGVHPAAHILTRRWSTVLRIAYHLARTHRLDADTLDAHLCAPHQATHALRARSWWRAWTRNPVLPPVGRRERPS